MPTEEMKFIAIKFEKMLDSDEANLTAFIQREVGKRTIRVDEANTSVKQKRESFRVQFVEMIVKAVTEASQKLPQQEFEAKIWG